MPVLDFFARRRASSLACRAGLVGLATAAVLALAAPAHAQEADPVIARVNGVEIRASDLALVEEEVGSNTAQMPGEAKREYLVTYLSDTMLVAQAAEAQKLADTPDFRRRLAFARNKLLSETLLQQEAKVAVTEPAMRNVYNEAVKQLSTEKEVHARHILVDTEDEAKAIIAELSKGGDFKELAKKSKEPDAGERGGDLGYFTKDSMVAEFAEVAFKLEPGKISDPVKTQFGWHVIKVEDRRDRPVPEFDKVKDQIETFLVRKSQSEMVGKLRAAAKIERVPAAPTAPAAPAEPKKP